MEAKIVYISHPIIEIIKKGSTSVVSQTATKNNLRLIRSICRDIHTTEIIPIAPCLSSFQYLDYNNFKELCFSIEVNHIFFKKKFMSEIWLFGNRIAPVMKQEIQWSH